MNPLPLTEPPLSVLIVDDDNYSHLLLDAYCKRLGYTTFHANNGEEAIACAEQNHPDIIFMDVVMPVMDGLEAARIIKSRQKVWRPIVFLTGMNQEAYLVAALENGGDDFLAKPANFTVLAAKLTSLKRTLQLNQQVNEQAQSLLAYHDAMQDELEIARELIQRFVYSPMRQDPAFDYWVMPAEELSGDVVAMTRTPTGVLHMMLADGIGHGLHAAVNVMPITPIFYGMSARGASLAEILHELDRTIHEQLPIDRFVSAILISADWHNARLQVWNGGIPKAYLLNDDNQIIGYCEPNNLPLGISRQQNIAEEIQEITWTENLRLVAYSDGLLEEPNPAGEQFGHERLAASLLAAPQGMEAEQLRAQLHTHLAEHALSDDASFALLRLTTPEVRQTVIKRIAPPQPGWHFELSFSAEELKHTDVVYLVMHLLEPLELPRSQSGPLQMALSELFANALEHGLLGLSSQLKHAEDIEIYYTERAQRLQALDRGEIRIGLQATQDAGTPILRLSMTDSGPGFDTSTLRGDSPVPGSHGRSGRGIPLLQRLSRKLQYNETGNHVEIEFSL